MRKIPLTQGKVALIDDIDYERVRQFNWYARCSQSGTWHALRNLREGSIRKTVLMHRFILNLDGSEPLVDHRDRDGLNNQKFNLRESDKRGNASNSKVRSDSASGIKGVRWDKRVKKWAVQITVERKQKWIGYFLDLDSASSAYDKAARAFHGEFANPNRGDVK